MTNSAFLTIYDTLQHCFSFSDLNRFAQKSWSDDLITWQHDKGNLMFTLIWLARWKKPQKDGHKTSDLIGS